MKKPGLTRNQKTVAIVAMLLLLALVVSVITGGDLRMVVFSLVAGGVLAAIVSILREALECRRIAPERP